MDKINFQVYFQDKKDVEYVEKLLYRITNIKPRNLLGTEENDVNYSFNEYYAGDFRFCLDVYIRSDLANFLHLQTDLDLAKKIVALEGQNILVSDDETNPYTWILLDRYGVIHNVTQNVNIEESIFINQKSLIEPKS